MSQKKKSPRAGRKSFRVGEIGTTIIEAFTRAFHSTVDVHYPRLGRTFVRIQHWTIRSEKPDWGGFIPQLSPHVTPVELPSDNAGGEWRRRRFSGIATAIFNTSLNLQNPDGGEYSIPVHFDAMFADFSNDIEKTRYMAGSWWYEDRDGSAHEGEFQYFIHKGEIKYDFGCYPVNQG